MIACLPSTHCHCGLSPSRSSVFRLSPLREKKDGFPGRGNNPSVRVRRPPVCFVAALLPGNENGFKQCGSLLPRSICSFLFPPHAQASPVKPHSSVLESTTDVNDKWDSKPVRLWRSFLWITKPFPRIVKASAAAVTWSKLGVRAYHYQRIRGAYT